jgi:cell wall-associated NlpC family hydrolase
LRFSFPGVRALLVAALAATILITAQPPAKAEAAGQADTVIANARHHLGAPWVWGTVGPYTFDCSGLVYHAFKEAGLGSRIGYIRSASGLYSYFRNKGLATTSGGRKGDIVVYGGGTHVGIYLGDGRVISTLTSGVAIHGLHAVTKPFTAFLRTNLTTATASSVVAVRYTTHVFNMRYGPGTSYGVVKQLPAGSVFYIYKSGLDRYGQKWFYGRDSRSRYGWIQALYTRL